MASLHQLLKLMVEKGASDLHITCGSPPQFRIDGHLVPTKSPPMSKEETQAICYSFLTESQKHAFEETNELDLSFGVKGLCRFRANVFVQRGAVTGTFRAIPTKIHSFSELGLPSVVGDLTDRRSGLVLVTGPTGSGKSTTLAAMVDKINSTTHGHILTIEDPIEYRTPIRSASSTSARWAPIRPTSRTRCATCCGRIPTWCWWASCAIWRPCRRP